MNQNDASLPASVITEMQQYGKIAAIKVLRDLEPGLGLADAKARVDAYEAGARVALPSGILHTLRAGERLRAVSTLGAELGIPLSEAVRQIDAALRADLDLRESYLTSCGLSELVRVSFQDGLAFPSGQVAPSSYRCVVYCRVPENWLEAGNFSGSALEAIYEMLYGSDWRNGNSDGSRYVVRGAQCERLDAAGKAARPWLSAVNNPSEQYWFARAMADGSVAKIERDLF